MQAAGSRAVPKGRYFLDVYKRRETALDKSGCYRSYKSVEKSIIPMRKGMVVKLSPGVIENYEIKNKPGLDKTSVVRVKKGGYLTRGAS